MSSYPSKAASLSDSSRSILHTRFMGSDDINMYYKTIGLLGTGTYGTVFKMISLKDNLTWAVKKTDRTQHKIEWETQILSSLRHSNIILVKELIETDNYYYMIMEFCSEGSLQEYSDKYGPFNEEEVKYSMQQLVGAVKYLHSLNIAHRDIKMENLLLKNRGLCVNSISHNSNSLSQYTIKIIDFGFSVKLKKNEEMMLSHCGTPLYMSPEVINGKSYSKQCDIWSIGIVMLILMTKRNPFNDSDTLKFDISHFNIINNPLPDGLDNFSSQCIEALRSLLNPDPIHRTSAAEFLNFSWITGKENIKTINVMQLMKNTFNARKIN